MAKDAILYIDLLGVQNMWKEGGPNVVKNRIRSFTNFIKSRAGNLPDNLYREGECTFILAGDSASILCQDFTQAIDIGIFLFVEAFLGTREAFLD